MIRRSSQPMRVCFLLSDAGVTAAAWVGAFFARHHTGLPVTGDPPTFQQCLGNLPLVMILAVAGYRWAGMYEVHRLRRFREELLAVLQGAALAALLSMASTFFRHDPYESRGTMLLFLGFAFAGTLIARRIAWSLIRRLRSLGFNQSRCVIVGTGRVARRTAKSIRGARWMGIKNLGFIAPEPSRWASDLPVLGTPDDLPRIIDANDVAHVFIALPMNQLGEARRVFDILAQSIVDVRIIADVPALAGLSLTSGTFDGMPMVGLRENAHFGLNLVVKRTMDVLLAAVGLLALSPLLAVIAVLVKRSSPGPVFYRQERCGLNGRPFAMLKFRTMPVDAEFGTGPVWAQKDDPRRTRLGSFLRSTSLDELPQLWNVLVGSMSLVGPRPERPHFIREFRHTIPSYMARHSAKAGITGWAQVHGWRGNTSLRKRVQYDLHYITHWTPWLDIRILWMTLFHGLRHRNAY